MKLIFVGDVHASSQDIKTRLDNSSETILAKLEWVLNKAANIGAGVIFTGDFLNGNQNNSQYLLRLIELFKKYEIPCYCIGGNHECRGDSYESYKQSQIQFLYHAGVLHFLDSNEFDIEMPDTGTLIRGYSAYSQLNEKDNEKVSILVCHHFIHKAFEDVLYVEPEELKQRFPNLRIIVAGHDHAFYPETTECGIRIVRPGSLLRVSSDKMHDRKPQVYMLSTPDFEGHYEEVPSLEYCDLFKIEEKQSEKGLEVKVRNFVESIKTNVVGNDVELILKSKVDKITEPDVKAYVIKKLNEQGYILG